LARKRKRGRQRQLDMAVATIHRRYGPWALVKGKPASTAGGGHVPHIPTGFTALDQALGIGGLPKGRMCELVGPATSGKTTLALKFLAQAQANGGQVAYIDQALHFDPDYAYRCGLDLSRLLVGTSYDLREALAMTEALVRSGSLSVLVFDALDFLWTDLQAAHLLAATLNRLPAALAQSGTILLVLHEPPIAHSATSSPLTGGSPAGDSSALSALAHYAAVRLQIVREDWVPLYDDIRGYNARVEVLKNQLGPAGRTVNLLIKFNGTVRGNGL
jgi:recombination protein RecA